MGSRAGASPPPRGKANPNQRFVHTSHHRPRLPFLRQSQLPRLRLDFHWQIFAVPKSQNIRVAFASEAPAAHAALLERVHDLLVVAVLAMDHVLQTHHFPAATAFGSNRFTISLNRWSVSAVEPFRSCRSSATDSGGVPSAHIRHRTKTRSTPRSWTI